MSYADDCEATPLEPGMQLANIGYCLAAGKVV
jgi:hypothetical protein